MADPALPRRLSLVAGLLTLTVGAGRYLLGGSELQTMVEAMGPLPQAVLLAVFWHAITLFLFLFGIALIVTAWGPRDRARAVAAMTAIGFGSIALMMATAAARTYGDPFAFYPVFALTVVALTSAAAAWRA